MRSLQGQRWKENNMDWQYVERKLERGFRASPRRYGSSLVVERRRPFPLARVMNAALSEDEQEEWGDLEEWPGSLAQLLEDHAVDEQHLLGFYWDGFGPMSWVAGLVLIGQGTKRYLCYWDETESYRALAAIEPWNDPLAVSGTVARVLARNGKGFGVDVFGSLPRETTNDAPALVYRAAVRQAYFDLLQWWEREYGSAWVDLAEEHYGRLVEPDHLRRCLDILEGLPRLDDGEAIGSWLSGREAESEAMPDQARQQLFDEWFGGAYDEPRRKDAA
jgi:hypothetical protein